MHHLQEFSSNDSSDEEDNADNKTSESTSNVYRWVFVAGVVDKFLFEIYFLGTILGIMIVLVIVPQKVNSFNGTSDLKVNS